MGTTANKLNKLITTKAAIKEAILNKGVTVTDTDTFASYADKINSITSGGGLEFDFTVLGYNLEECKDANNIANAAITLGDFTQSLITEAIAYGKELYDSNYDIDGYNVDKDKLLFYPKLKLPYVYSNSKVLYIPNVEYKASGSTTSNAYANYFLYKVGNINAVFTSSHYSLGFFLNCYSLREVGDINITGKVIPYNNFFLNCYTLRKIGNMNTTGSTNFDYMFGNCISLTSIPLLDISKGTTFNSIFLNCTFDVDGLDFSNAAGQLSYLKPFYSYAGKRVSNIKTTKYSALFFSGNTNIESATNIDVSASTDHSLNSMFLNCHELKEVSLSGTSNITNFHYMFAGCSSLTSIPLLDTSSGTDLGDMFYSCNNLKRIEGISLKSLNTTVGNTYLTGYNDMKLLRYALIKDIGTCTGMTSISFINWDVWGVDDETIPESVGARQSLIDSLLTYSFDRATAGYSTCTISLWKATKAALTSDEIAQITSKGYTIA